MVETKENTENQEQKEEKGCNCCDKENVRRRMMMGKVIENRVMSLVQATPISIGDFIIFVEATPAAFFSSLESLLQVLSEYNRQDKTFNMDEIIDDLCDILTKNTEKLRKMKEAIKEGKPEGLHVITL